MARQQGQDPILNDRLDAARAALDAAKQPLPPEMAAVPEEVTIQREHERALGTLCELDERVARVRPLLKRLGIGPDEFDLLVNTIEHWRGGGHNYRSAFGQVRGLRIRYADVLADPGVVARQRQERQAQRDATELVAAEAKAREAQAAAEAIRRKQTDRG